VYVTSHRCCCICCCNDVLYQRLQFAGSARQAAVGGTTAVNCADRGAHCDMPGTRSVSLQLLLSLILLLLLLLPGNSKQQ